MANELKHPFEERYGPIMPKTKEQMDYAIQTEYIHPDFRDGIITVDKMLDNVDLKLEWYIPSIHAMKFMSFIRLVLGEEPENSNPITHYFLIDCIFQSPNVKPFFDIRNIDFNYLVQESVVLCGREFSKTTLITYLLLFMADEGEIPEFGKLNYGLYVSDSMRNGVKKMMLRLRGIYNESVYLQSKFEEVNITQEDAIFVRHPRTKREVAIYNEFVNRRKKDKTQVPGRMKRTFKIDGLGCAALNLDARLFTENGNITIGECKVGDKIIGADGKLTTITYKSEVFEKPMYELLLEDGRSLKVCQDHINSAELKYDYKGGRPKYKNVDLTTTELLKKDFYWTRQKKKNGKYVTISEKLIWIKNCKPIEYKEKDFPVDPYTLGLLLGDGSIGNKYGSASLHMVEDDLNIIKQYIPYKMTRFRIDKRSKSKLTTIGISNIGQAIVSLKANVTCKFKFIPKIYFKGSIKQRLDILRGLIDTDGEIKPDGKIKFSSTSKQLTIDVTEIVRSLGGTVFNYNRKNKSKLGVKSISYIAEISIDFRVSNLPRKYNNQKKNRRRDKRVGVVSLKRIETVKSQCIAVDNDEHQFIADNYFRTHNTSSRGASNVLTRPQFVFIDDVVANEAYASSSIILESIESTIEADIRGGLSGSGYFMVAIGTPFNKNDPIYRRVEEGLMLPIVFPRAAQMPTDDIKEEDFESVWPDRHTYKNCKREYMNAKKASDNGNDFKMRKLMQEHYLRIASDEDRLIPDSLIQWYKVNNIVSNAWKYNWYMTTDYTVSGSRGSDFSGAALWAVGSEGDWFMVALVLRKMELEDQYNETFDMVEMVLGKVRWVEVGVEVDGQQPIHIYALKEKMTKRNTYFTIARQKGSKVGSEGIRSRLEGGDKHWRLKQILPMFQNHKIWFPEELKYTPDMKELLEEIKYTTYRSINAKHDDGIDTLSQIGMMEVIYPAKELKQEKEAHKPMKNNSINRMIWNKKHLEQDDISTAYDSYV